MDINLHEFKCMQRNMRDFNKGRRLKGVIENFNYFDNRVLYPDIFRLPLQQRALDYIANHGHKGGQLAYAALYVYEGDVSFLYLMKRGYYIDQQERIQHMLVYVYP